MSWYPGKRFLYWLSSYFRPHTRGPVRRMFSGGLLATLAFGLLAAVSLSTEHTQVMIQLPSGNTTVTVGEPFQVEVRIDAQEPINAVEMDLLYPEQYMVVEQLRDGESVLTIWTEEPTAENGVIHVRGGTFRRGFIDEHRVIAWTARATQAGTFRIRPQHIQLLAGDGSGTEVKLDDVDMPPLELTAVSAEDAAPAEAAAVSQEATDLNGDGLITMQDISIFMSAWGSEDTIYDFTGDNRMSFPDFSIILAHYFFGQ